MAQRCRGGASRWPHPRHAAPPAPAPPGGRASSALSRALCYLCRLLLVCARLCSAPLSSVGCAPSAPLGAQARTAMRLRGRGPRAAPSSSSGAGDARRLAPPGRNPFVHELRLSALQKAQVGSPQRCCALPRMCRGCSGEGLGAARSLESRAPPLQHPSSPRQGPASRRLRAC